MQPMTNTPSTFPYPSLGDGLVDMAGFASALTIARLVKNPDSFKDDEFGPLSRPPEERWLKLNYASNISLIPAQEIKNWVDKRNLLSEVNGKKLLCEWRPTEVNGLNKWLFSFSDILRLMVIDRLRVRIPLISLEASAEIADLCLKRFLHLYDPVKGFPAKEFHTAKLVLSINDDGSLSSMIVDAEQAPLYWNGYLSLVEHEEFNKALSGNHSDGNNPPPFISAMNNREVLRQGINFIDEVCFFVFGIDSFIARNWPNLRSMMNIFESMLASDKASRGFRGRARGRKRD